MRRHKKITSETKIFLACLILLGAFVLLTCRASFGFSKAPPKVETPVPTPKPSPSPVADLELDQAKALIFAVVDSDDCSKERYLWGKPEKDQYSKAPKGYSRGLALSVAQVACSPESDVYKVATAPLGSASKDVLAHYGVTAETPSLRLSNTAAIMIGSNLKESSWRPCVGRDVNAKASDVQGCLHGSGSTCEAGLDQGSYNSVGKTGPQRDLFNSFSSYPKGCFRPEYYGSITCTDANWKNHGSDPKAVQYQKMAKECPGYTVQAGFMRFRELRTHYGPLNRKTAELKKSCVARFEKVQKLVADTPAICKVLR